MNLKIFLISLISFSALAQVDPDASAPTKRLYDYLNQISLSIQTDQKILIGHQNAFFSGRGWQLNNENLGQDLKSDMHLVAGIHPAVFGIDFLEISDSNRDFILERMRLVHERQGVNTLSWHLKTLIDDGVGDNGYMDTTSQVVKHILPGGMAHQKFLDKLNSLVNFLNQVKNIPVVFRPWHEHNFSWFWWGKDHCTKEEYIALWRFTVDYLRSQGVHNLLYAYSPAHIRDDYFDRYPGDEYIDILGTDFYFKTPKLDEGNLGPNPLAQWKKKVVWLMEQAHIRNKIPVLAEFGQEGIGYDRFWTDYLGWPLEKAGIEQVTGPDNVPKRGIAWVLLWRNDPISETHYYGPAGNHKNNENFINLMNKNIFIGL